MKKYEKPVINETIIMLEDVILSSGVAAEYSSDRVGKDGGSVGISDILGL